MSPTPIATPDSYADLRALATRIREVLADKKFLLLYAYNGVGKTRLSTEFKDIGKMIGADGVTTQRDTLYYNAFTEDLFVWDNDLRNDRRRFLKINTDSTFFAGLEQFEMDNRIRKLLDRYADFDFRIDTTSWEITFSRELTVGTGATATTQLAEDIKISRGEENLFIWCFFLAVVELAIAREQAYNWVQNVYIDDPISSLDEENAVAVAVHLAGMLKEDANPLKTVVSTHHPLFFNIVYNELRRTKGGRRFFLGRSTPTAAYTLTDTEDTPFFHHVANLMELHEAARTGQIFAHHFNMLRVIVEKTASFLGYDDFRDCIKRDDQDTDGVLHNRLLNLLSHGGYSLYEPRELLDDNKAYFQKMLQDFTERFAFNPSRFQRLAPATVVTTPPTGTASALAHAATAASAPSSPALTDLGLAS